MAVASTKTKLPLSTWARIMGIHPLHFNQVRLSEDVHFHCDQLMFQYAWQTADHVAREDIAIAIAEAESRIENALHYRLTPSWEKDEWRDTPEFFQRNLSNLSATTVNGYPQTVNAKWGYFIAGGIERKDVIELASDIIYTDEDSDGYFETATVAVITTATNKNEIAVYYPDKNGQDIWEIRPTTVVIGSGVATITFRRENAVVPELLDRFDIEDAEAIGQDNDDFLTTVDVYRHWNDPQQQASYLWTPLQTVCGACTGEGCPQCAFSAQAGCLVSRGDPRQSILYMHAGLWNADTDQYDFEQWAVRRTPDVVRLYYYAGWQDKSLDYTNRMDPEWERAVTYMSAALLDRPPCDCVKGHWERWRQDLTLVAGDEDGKPYFRQPTKILDNPFGSTRGELYAWRKVRELIIGDGTPV